MTNYFPVSELLVREPLLQLYHSSSFSYLSCIPFYFAGVNSESTSNKSHKLLFHGMCPKKLISDTAMGEELGLPKGQLQLRSWGGYSETTAGCAQEIRKNFLNLICSVF